MATGHAHDDARGGPAHEHGAHEHGAHEHGAHEHGAQHAHGGHAHGSAPQRALAIAFALTAIFALVEAAGGFISGSLALLSDAGHMVADAAALGVAMFAQHIARRPPSPRASYGYARAEVLAAFVNALAMLAIVAAITFEAVHRFASPQPVRGLLVVVVASLGLVVNLVAAWVLARAQSSLNVRAAMLHVVGDLLGSVAAIVAGVVIAWTGWLPIDPLLSVAISLLILRSTWRLLRQTVGVLMEGVPAHLDYEAIGNALSRLPGVVNVHDLHVWQTGGDDVALSAHLALTDAAQWPRTLAAAQRLLRERFAIAHVTLQPAWPLELPAGARVIAVKAAAAPRADAG